MRTKTFLLSLMIAVPLCASDQLVLFQQQIEAHRISLSPLVSLSDVRPDSASDVTQIWRYRPDLSYVPENAPPDDTLPFAHCDFFFLQPGSEEKAEEMTKDLVAIDRSAGIRHAWRIYTALTGSELPLMIQIVRAKDRESYEAERARSEQMRGERAKEVYRRSPAVERKTTVVEATFGAAPGVEPLALPGANGVVTLDYLAFDPSTHRLWVPAANTGDVDVIEGDSITPIHGFATAPFKARGQTFRIGPSSVSVGDGVVYVGNRADATICAIDAKTLKILRCTKVATPAEGPAATPDAVVYVGATKEVWMTRGAPPIGIASSDRSLSIFRASKQGRLRLAGKMPLGGSAEGYAVDDGRGLFYTNIEESGETVAIDVRKRAIVARWRSGCAEPHGLAVDRKRQFLFVACSDRVIGLDLSHGGRVAASVTTGEGLDNIDYLEANETLYAAADRAATLTLAHVSDAGTITTTATVPTLAGTRVVVAGDDGTAYVADPARGRILRVRFR